MAQDLPSGNPSIILKDSKLEKIFDSGSLTEGPAVAPDGTIYFVDVTVLNDAGRIWQYNPETEEATIYRSPGGAALGIEFDAEGRMVIASAALFGCSCISRIDLSTGKSEILAGLYEGKPFNGPNDLAIDELGRIYFTDYGYAAPQGIYYHRVKGVYRIDTTSIQRVIDHPGSPNGIVISPDQKTLYVSYGQSDIHGTGVITSYDILDDGKVSLPSILIQFPKGTFGADGLAVDREGNVYAALFSSDRTAKGFGVAIYSPLGKQIAFIPVPGGATNLAFGRGDYANILYITSGPNLYRIKLGKEGYHLRKRTQRTIQR